MITNATHVAAVEIKRHKEKCLLLSVPLHSVVVQASGCSVRAASCTAHCSSKVQENQEVHDCLLLHLAFCSDIKEAKYIVQRYP